MQRAITAEPTKATIGLTPYTTKGVVNRRSAIEVDDPTSPWRGRAPPARR
jgi:hypothetical protein